MEAKIQVGGKSPGELFHEIRGRIVYINEPAMQLMYELVWNRETQH